MGAAQGASYSAGFWRSSKTGIVFAIACMSLAYSTWDCQCPSGGSGAVSVAVRIRSPPPAAAAAAAALALGSYQRPLRGPVAKAGLPNMTLVHPKLEHACQLDRWNWVQAAKRAKSLGRTAAPRELLAQAAPCQRCQVLGNHDYQVLYVRHAKTASTSVWHYFGQCERQAEPQPGCLKPFSSAEAGDQAGWGALSEAELADVWSRYFVFTVVRDPFERAVSAYHWLLRTVLADPPSCRNLTDWDQYCESPLSLSRQCLQRPECCYTQVDWFLDHHDEQAHCILADGGGLAVDYVARTESLEEDMAAIVRIVNERRRSGLAPLPAPSLLRENTQDRCTNGSNETRSEEHSPALMHGNSFFDTDAWREEWQGLLARERYCTTERYYIRRHGHCRAGVAAYYADDVALLT